MAKFLLVDDHPVVRTGLRHILESAYGISSVEEAGSAEEAIDMTRSQSFDSVILDVSLPGKSGLATLKQIKTERPELPVLILSVHGDCDYGVRALKLGASGYMDKSAAPERLLEAVACIREGRRYVTSALSQYLANNVCRDSAHNGHQILSEREFEVFRLIATGNSTAEVARRLFLSPKTVHTHRRSILKKLGLKSNADLVRYAYQNNLVQ